MGCFSWTKAERSAKVANVREGAPFKLLIPKEFGGGFIKDRYRGYGKISDGKNEYDMYELLAFWNSYLFPDYFVLSRLLYDGEFPKLKPIDRYTDHNRGLGIDIGCYVPQVNNLKYPLKLVSVSYKGTYEDCKGRSYGDPNQGWGPLSWAEVDALIERNYMPKR